MKEWQKPGERGMVDAEMNVKMDEQARLVFNFYPPRLDILGDVLQGGWNVIISDQSARGGIDVQ